VRSPYTDSDADLFTNITVEPLRRKLKSRGEFQSKITFWANIAFCIGALSFIVWLPLILLVNDLMVRLSVALAIMVALATIIQYYYFRKYLAEHEAFLKSG